MSTRSDAGPSVTRRSQIAGLLLFALVFVSVLFIRGESPLVDFDVFYKAGSRALSGEPLYSPADGHYQFKYLPTSALFFSPLALVSPPIARSLWITIICSSLFLITLLLWRLVPFPKAELGWLLFIVCVGVAKFVGRELILGQANLVFLAITIAGLFFYLKGYQFRGGILLGLAILLKPYALIFLPYLVMRRSGRTLGGITCMLLGGLALPVAFLGWQESFHLHVDWWTVVSQSTSPLLSNQDNISLMGVISRWGIFDSVKRVAIAAYGIAGILALLLALRLIREGLLRTDTTIELSQPESQYRVIRDFAYMLILIPLVSPQGWDYVLVLSIPTLWLVSRFRGSLGRYLLALTGGVVCVMGLSLYDLLGRDLYSRFMQGGVLMLCALYLAIVVLFLHTRRENQTSPTSTPTKARDNS